MPLVTLNPITAPFSGFCENGMSVEDDPATAPPSLDRELVEEVMYAADTEEGSGEGIVQLKLEKASSCFAFVSDKMSSLNDKIGDALYLC